MTEFEKVIEELVYKIDEDWAIFMPSANDYIKEFAPKLLSAAHKQLIGENKTIEFEEELKMFFENYASCENEISDEEIKKAAKELLFDVREQFIEEACKWLDDNLLNYWSQAYTDNCDFIEDFRNALEKG